MIEFIKTYYASIAGATILLGILIGIALKKNRKVHPKIMIGCFLADAALVAYLELARHAATGTLTGTGGMTNLLFIHIILATVNLALYICLIVSGAKILKGKEHLRARHRVFAGLLILIRISVMVTAIMVVQERKANEAAKASADTGTPAELPYIPRS